MTHDREEDILYLAHHLWEEAGAPMSAAPAYWKEAALQVLARCEERNQPRGTVVTFSPRRTNDNKCRSSSCLISVKNGRDISIAAHGQWRVTFTLGNVPAVVANCPQFDLGRKVD